MFSDWNVQKVEVEGGLAFDRFCEGCHQEIADYSMRDVDLVREIYYRRSFASESGPGREVVSPAEGAFGYISKIIWIPRPLPLC